MHEISGRIVGRYHSWRCLVVTREYFINPVVLMRRGWHENKNQVIAVIHVSVNSDTLWHHSEVLVRAKCVALQTCKWHSVSSHLRRSISDE